MRISPEKKILCHPSRWSLIAPLGKEKRSTSGRQAMDQSGLIHTDSVFSLPTLGAVGLEKKKRSTCGHACGCGPRQRELAGVVIRLHVTREK